MHNPLKPIQCQRPISNNSFQEPKISTNIQQTHGNLGAREMALYLRTFAALAGDLVLVPSTYMAVNNYL